MIDDNLLTDRFALAVHRDSRTRARYALVITKRGLRLPVDVLAVDHCEKTPSGN